MIPTMVVRQITSGSCWVVLGGLLLGLKANWVYAVVMDDCGTWD